MRYQVMCQDCHFVYVKEIIDFTDMKYNRIPVDDFDQWKKGKLNIEDIERKWVGFN